VTNAMAIATVEQQQQGVSFTEKWTALADCLEQQDMSLAELKTLQGAFSRMYAKAEALKKSTHGAGRDEGRAAYQQFLESKFVPPATRGREAADAATTRPADAPATPAGAPATPAGAPATPGRVQAAASALSPEEQRGQEDGLHAALREARYRLTLSEARVRRLIFRLSRRPSMKVWQQRVRRLQRRIRDARRQYRYQARMLLDVRANLLLEKRQSAIRMDAEAKRQIEALRSEVRQAHHLLAEANSKVEQLTGQVAAGRLLQTMESRPGGGVQYTNDVVRACVSLVLDCHVPIRYVSSAIRKVVEQLCGMQVENLPSVSHISAVSYSVGGSLAKASAMEKLLVAAQDDKALTLMTDATSKRGEHWSDWQISTGGNEQVTLALRPVEGGTAEMYALSVEDRVRLKRELFIRINFLMTDRHVVNKCLLVLLNEMRDTFARQAGEDQPEKVTALFCGMHAIVNLAAAAESGLKAWEACVSSQPLGAAALPGFWTSKAESAYHQDGLQGVSSALGNEQCGVAVPYETYLQSQGAKPFQMEDFRGNRAYVIFPNGGHVFRQRELLLTFLTEYPCSNRLLLAVQADLASNVLLLSGCRALGVIDMLVIRPLWMLNRQSTVRILDMNQRYEQLCDWLRGAGHWQSGGTASAFRATRAAHFLTLLGHWTNDLLSQALQVTAAYMLVLLRREVCDHLPGGALRNLSDEQRRLTADAPKDNVAPERNFAVLDSTVTCKPHMRPLAREAYVLFQQNATEQWLHQKTRDEQEAMLSRARKISGKAIDKARQQLQQARIEAVHRKRVAKDCSLRDHMRAVHEFGGVWITVSDMTEALQQLPSGRHEQAVTAQLRLQKAMKPTLPRDLAALLNLSRAGVRRSLPALTANLRQVIAHLEAEKAAVAVAVDTQGNTNIRPCNERAELVRSAVTKKLEARQVAATTGQPAPRWRSRQRACWKADVWEVLFGYTTRRGLGAGVVVRRCPPSGTNADILEQKFKVVFDDHGSTTFEYNLYEDYLKGDLHVLSDDE
uniref:DUF659 domain-containing protein n=1 Tax=Macrostomum lignano TaxID=282301 RepID=A0A1I8IPW8_9PLAT